MSLTALIDGDVLVYRCGFAAEHNEYTVLVDGEPKHSCQYKKDMNQWIKENIPEGVEYVLDKKKHIEPLSFCLQTVKATIKHILKAVKADDYIVALSPSRTFRHDLATIKPYKGNRDELAKPVHYEKIRKYLVKRHNPVLIENIEADDVLGIMQTKDTVICTIDKDLDMIPGYHYNFVTEEKYWVTEEDALYCFYHQLLTGDSTDNIQGIPGCGDMTATKLLSACHSQEDMESAVRNAYLEYSPERGLAELEETRKLIWILREPPQ